MATDRDQIVRDFEKGLTLPGDVLCEECQRAVLAVLAAKTRAAYARTDDRPWPEPESRAVADPLRYCVECHTEHGAPFCAPKADGR